MKWVDLLRFILVLGLLLPLKSIAQEEDSAEIWLEEYTDEFQESFFEALKQKGIENYDKAINALLRCKELDPGSHVVDHELAKTYKLNKQIAIAQEFALEALRKQPENLWYLNTYIGMMSPRSLDLGVLKEQIPYDNLRLKENLAYIFVEKGDYERASVLLNKMQRTEVRTKLLARIADSLERKNNKVDSPSVVSEEKELNPMQILERELKELLDKGEYARLNTESTQALEAYPLQPFFYYTRGVALNGLGDFKSAVEYLTMGLDFINEDQELTNDFYRELAEAYQGLGAPAKANEYLSKIKNGS